MDNLYRENILDHFKNPRNYGHLDTPDATFIENNPLCGDRIGIEVKLETRNSKFEIKEIRFFGEGCAISTASASMLTEAVRGKKIKFAMRLTTKQILKLLGITLTPNRLKCAILPLEALQKTLGLVKI